MRWVLAMGFSCTFAVLRIIPGITEYSPVVIFGFKIGAGGGTRTHDVAIREF